MTPTCTIGSVLQRMAREYLDPAVLGPAPPCLVEERACSGPLAPIQLVPDEVLVAKYPEGVFGSKAENRLGGEITEWRPFENQRLYGEGPSYGVLSLDEVREAVTVGGKCEWCDGRGEGRFPERFPDDLSVRPCPTCHGTGREFTVCSQHRALLAGAIPAANIAKGEQYPEVEPPKLNLSDLLRVECPRQCSHGLVRGCERDNEFVKWVPCRTCDGTGTIPHPALSDAMGWVQRLGFEGVLS